MVHGLIKFGKMEDSPTCPICNSLLRGKGEDYICEACHIHIKLTKFDKDKPLTEQEMHADFCEDFRKYTDNPRPKPRSEEP